MASIVYLIAKKHMEPGCIAVRTVSGITLAGLVTYLRGRLQDKGIQILTISDMDTYAEYAPYHLVETELEFIIRAFGM